MAYRYYIFCRSKKPLGRADLLELMEMDFDFVDDHAPRFDPPKAKGPGVLDVHYDGDEGFIKIDLKSDFDAIVEETIEDLALPGALAKRLRETRNVVMIQPHGELERDIWGMLAVVEKFLLREHDGVLFNQTGIYDAEDRPLYERKKR